MPIEAFRVCRRIHAALDGEGAFRAGGRWNSPGRRMVYMAESVALAVLENLVHMARQDFPTGYVRITVTLPDDLFFLSEADLRRDRTWRDLPTRNLGDAWLDARLSAVLRVRSVVILSEWNYLLNPRHPDFSNIVVRPQEPFTFDERLFA
jgi:RES domain-containing protein